MHHLLALSTLGLVVLSVAMFVAARRPRATVDVAGDDGRAARRLWIPPAPSAPHPPLRHTIAPRAPTIPRARPQRVSAPPRFDPYDVDDDSSSAWWSGDGD